MGPLAGYRIIEMAGIGPGPFCAMMLADMGAELIRIDRPGQVDLGLAGDPDIAPTLRGRPAVRLDLKQPEARALVLRLAERADALIEGFRPGVMERLGLGPAECQARNPRLVFGRMTGWGQEGPLAQAAGHDINYIALTGALAAIGPAGQPPAVPLNLVGDFGGGALYLCVGVLAGLLAAGRGGKGTVVDAAMVDGASSLLTSLAGHFASGRWSEARGTNVLDGGAHFYRVYETADGRYVAVGAIEHRFYRTLLERIGLGDDAELLNEQHNQAKWPVFAQRLEARFRTRTRDEWTAILEGTDACYAPVLTLSEAPSHPHMRARATYAKRDGYIQPSPAPRFDGGLPPPAPTPSAADTLRRWGLTGEELAALEASGALPEVARHPA